MNRNLIRCFHALSLGLAIGSWNGAAAASVTPPEGADDATFSVWLDEQRNEVAQQRAAAHQAYGEQEFVCWRRFAVNDCLRAARLQRRQTLDALRQWDLQLNDAERERRTERRLRALAEKKESE